MGEKYTAIQYPRSCLHIHTTDLVNANSWNLEKKTDSEEGGRKIKKIQQTSTSVSLLS